MKNLISVLFFTLSFLIVQGQETSKKFQSKYFVAFCSEEASKNSAAGHAFITIGKGDPFTCNIDDGDGEAFGLYAADIEHTDCVPSKFNALVSPLFVGGLPGCLFSDLRTSVDNYLILQCTFEEYLSVQSEIESWKRKNYQLTSQDCLTFVIDVAQLFSNRLTIPPRSRADLPNKYLLKLKALNKSDY